MNDRAAKEIAVPALAQEAALPVLPAFGGIGLEMEFMIVDADTLDVRPLADRVLVQDGCVVNELARGALGWSNELVLHVLEVKNREPRLRLDALAPAFCDEIGAIEGVLAAQGARLMPGAMHPWMNPEQEMRLWPHDNQAIYRAYDRIFDCRGHGWANLQSMHINLPFADDREFTRLHEAVRLLLPILPALAASSPLADGAYSGWMDYRMHVYDGNAQGFPSITGQLIPEPVTSRAAYEECILHPMYRAIAAHDPQGLLQYEWLNSRAAIARFDRNAIEIRVIDTQECVAANMAVAAATLGAVRFLYHEEAVHAQPPLPTESLAAILQACMRDAERAQIDDAAYLHLLGIREPRATAGEVWCQLLEHLSTQDSDVQRCSAALRLILEQGPLARRILRAMNLESGTSGSAPRALLQTVYRRLCDCLRDDCLFDPSC